MRCLLWQGTKYKYTQNKTTQHDNTTVFATKNTEAKKIRIFISEHSITHTRSNGWDPPSPFTLQKFHGIILLHPTTITTILLPNHPNLSLSPSFFANHQSFFSLLFLLPPPPPPPVTGIMEVSVATTPRKSLAEKVFGAYSGSFSMKKRGGAGSSNEAQTSHVENTDDDGGLELMEIGAERTKNVLILMSDTGGGHRASAEAIRDAFQIEFGDEYRVGIFWFHSGSVFWFPALNFVIYGFVFIFFLELFAEIFLHVCLILLDGFCLCVLIKDVWNFWIFSDIC